MVVFSFKVVVLQFYVCLLIVKHKAFNVIVAFLPLSVHMALGVIKSIINSFLQGLGGIAEKSVLTSKLQSSS